MPTGHQRYIDDFWSKKARQNGLRARSYYKLEEIDQKYELLKPGMQVVDLGASPGSWTQYVLRKTKGNVKVIAVDLKEIEPFSEYKDKVFLHRSDVADFGECCKDVDVVLSDMAPDTSGIKHADSLQSLSLVETAFSFAQKSLKEGGALVLKFLQGCDVNDLKEVMKEHFEKIYTMKPKCSRPSSSEIFFVCLRFKKNQ